MQDLLPTLTPRSWKQVFLLVLVPAMVVQTVLWLKFTPLDQGDWAQAVHGIAVLEPVGESHPAYGYPGTTILYASAVFVHFGFSDATALWIGFALLMSLAIAAVAAAAYALRPRSFWWLLVAWALVFSPVYLQATLPSALVAVLASLLALLLFILDKESGPPRASALLWLGALGGVMLATRLDISALILGSVALYLWLRFKDVRVPFLLAAAAIPTFFIFDPYLWFDPVGHISAILDKMLAHAGRVSSDIGVMTLIQSCTAGVVGFVVALLLRLYPVALARSAAALWLLLTTAAATVLLLLSHHHPGWLFYQVFLAWELLLPLLLLEGLPVVAARFSTQDARTVTIAVVSFVVGAYVAYYAFAFSDLMVALRVCWIFESPEYVPPPVI